MPRIAMTAVDLSLDYCCEEWYSSGEKCSRQLVGAVDKLLGVCLDLWTAAEEQASIHFVTASWRPHPRPHPQAKMQAEEKECLFKYRTQVYECSSGQGEESDQLQAQFPVYDDDFAPVEDHGDGSGSETAGNNISSRC